MSTPPLKPPPWAPTTRTGAAAVTGASLTTRDNGPECDPACVPVPAHYDRGQMTLLARLKARCHEYGQATAAARAAGAEDFASSMRRLEEAQNVLQLAWDSEMFADCWEAPPSSFFKGGGGAVVARALASAGDETVTGIKERTLRLLEERGNELLAQQYPDLRVKANPPPRYLRALGGGPYEGAGRKSWVVVVGAPTVAVK